MQKTNYLLPVDARLKSDRDVEDEAVALDRVLVAIEGCPYRKLDPAGMGRRIGPR
jgi:hypothetical protein